jgi:hypothetical protein
MRLCLHTMMQLLQKNYLSITIGILKSDDKQVSRFILSYQCSENI